MNYLVKETLIVADQQYCSGHLAMSEPFYCCNCFLEQEESFTLLGFHLNRADLDYLQRLD